MNEIETMRRTLDRLQQANDTERAAHAKALLLAMQGVQVALTELVAASEREQEAPEGDESAAVLEAIAELGTNLVHALQRITIRASDVTVRPTFNVEAPSVTVQPQITVQQPPAPVNNITVPPAEPAARPIRYDVVAETDRYGAPTGKMSITPIYS